MFFQWLRQLGCKHKEYYIESCKSYKIRKCLVCGKSLGLEYTSISEQQRFINELYNATVDMWAFAINPAWWCDKPNTDSATKTKLNNPARP